MEIPSIVTSVAANQEKTAEDCAAAGYITYLGRAENVTEAQIVSALNAMTKERLKEQTKRMRDMFGDSGTAYGAYLRKATEADAEMLFRWRNEPETRANSFHMEPIPYEEHVVWLADALRNPAQEIYIFCDGDVLIGQVRLSAEGDAATISYSIDAAYRAQGYGKEMLRCVEKLCAKRGNPRVLRGYVKKENIASQVIFEKLGYKAAAVPEMDCILYMKNKLQGGI